jgi:hypothetical protein
MHSEKRFEDSVNETRFSTSKAFICSICLEEQDEEQSTTENLTEPQTQT